VRGLAHTRAWMVTPGPSSDMEITLWRPSDIAGEAVHMPPFSEWHANSKSHAIRRHSGALVWASPPGAPRPSSSGVSSGRPGGRPLTALAPLGQPSREERLAALHQKRGTGYSGNHLPIADSRNRIS